ncbi:MAG: ribose 5-phosphate isomerase B [Gemmatimonadota bacterium]
MTARIAIGADHAGYRYKSRIAAELRDAGYEVIDLGTDSDAPVDYPDYAAAVAQAVVRGDAERGIIVCGSAVGVCVAANKVPGVRAGICHDSYSARQGVEHDDMNVLCLGERVIGIEIAREVVRAYLGARFSAEPRHVRRLDKVKAIERRYLREPEEPPGGPA